MTRTLVKTVDVINAIITGINGTTLNGGTMTAVAQPGNHAITVKVHTDSNPTGQYAYTWDLQLR